MPDILNGILKGLFEWLYGLFLDLIEYCANALLSVMSTDLTYFEESVPVIKDMWQIFVAVGWALLIGNLVFQAMKSMLSGLGFESESPSILFARTFVFGFLLLASRQICEIGLSISSRVIFLLQIPTSVNLRTPDSSFFNAGGATWLLVIIIGVILGINFIKLFFEIGERYVVVCILTFMSPMAFAMGGSKSTKEIFTGYIRMYSSMLLMMIMNVVFLKLVLSAMATMPSNIMVLPWCVLVVALVKVARKIDNLISRIGLNPAITGDSLGRGGMATFMAARMVMNTVSRVKSGSKGSGGHTSSSTRSSSSSYGGSAYSHSNSNMGGASFGGANTKTGGNFQNQNAHNNTGNYQNAWQNQNTQQNQNNRYGEQSQNSRFGGNQSQYSAQTAQSTRSGTNVQTSSASSGRYSQSGGTGTVSNNVRSGNVQSNNVSSGRFSQNTGVGGSTSNVRFGGTAGPNTNRFGTSGAPDTKNPAQSGKSADKASAVPLASSAIQQTKGAKSVAGAISGSVGKTPGVHPNTPGKGKPIDSGSVKKGSSATNTTTKMTAAKAPTSKPSSSKIPAGKTSGNKVTDVKSNSAKTTAAKSTVAKAPGVKPGNIRQNVNQYNKNLPKPVSMKSTQIAKGAAQRAPIKQEQPPTVQDMPAKELDTGGDSNE